jgi:molybdopterin-containing oxidoreductase family iron-sulfur binding subunit
MSHAHEHEHGHESHPDRPNRPDGASSSIHRTLAAATSAQVHEPERNDLRAPHDSDERAQSLATNALAAQRGRRFWRSLDELAGTESFDDFIRREYPSQVHKLADLPERREFLKLMGASLALAGVAGCTRQPTEKIVPYARMPESAIPGKPRYFATAMPWSTGAIGILVESHEGRPTKIEGNPDHPASLGATDAITQASVLGLYDPDRSQTVMHRGRISTWDAFLTDLKTALTAQEAKEGEGLRILTPTVTSPTLAKQCRAVLDKFGRAKWHQYEPVNRDNSRGGSAIAFGQDVCVQPRFDRAAVVLSLECDFLGSGPQNVRAIRDFASRRHVRESAREMNRLYVVESTPTNTGAMADHRLPLRSSDILHFARALAQRLGVKLAAQKNDDPAIAKWVDAVAKDLEKHRGASLVVVGESQHPVVHALAHSMNTALGNSGETVVYTSAIEFEGIDQFDSIKRVARDMQAGKVEVLLIVSGNPAYDAPVDAEFAKALEKVPLRVHLSLYDDETSELCDWHIPATHFLEAWGDARAFDGTVSIVQPLIAPLYNGRSAHELLAAVVNQSGTSAYEIVREHWREEIKGDFESTWRRALHDGVIAGTAFEKQSLKAQIFNPAPAAVQPGIEIVFRPDPFVWDGRFANNGWLQELPKPLTKLTWDNCAEMSPALAAKLGVENEQVIEIERLGKLLRLPVWIAPGHADNCITLGLGYGRRRGGAVAKDAGYDVTGLRFAGLPWSAPDAHVTVTEDRAQLASTQVHESMEGRDIVRVGTIDRFRENPRFFAHASESSHADEKRSESEHAAPKHTAAEEQSSASTLFTTPMPRPTQPAEHAWGMVIDLNACTACGACVAACQSENNIPVVGKDQVRRGRAMHWLRVDRYFEGEPAHPSVAFQPIPCMHCENAPCEVVCPVAATTHSAEGLNEMTYNRCVGTRYCSNNCPYKVRRFNFYLYSDFTTESLKLQRNPDVSVRSRGVMEKCTYCVQRINEAKLNAKNADRPIREGEIQTACQAVCPAQAIVFGDIADPKSAVAKLKSEPHNYGLLEELNTRPRTTYLARLRNPNPELEA